MSKNTIELKNVVNILNKELVVFAVGVNLTLISEEATDGKRLALLRAEDGTIYMAEIVKPEVKLIPGTMTITNSDVADMAADYAPHLPTESAGKSTQGCNYDKRAMATNY